MQRQPHCARSNSPKYGAAGYAGLTYAQVNPTIDELISRHRNMLLVISGQ